MARPPQQSFDGTPTGSDPAADMRVLVVDDDQDIRRLLAKVIGMLDMQVSQAHNGAQALRMFRESAFDLVITDIQMPKMDGYRLMRELKSLSQDLPVVLITGMSAEQVQRDAGAADAASVLHKPFRLEAITGAVERILGRLKAEGG